MIGNTAILLILIEAVPHVEKSLGISKLARLLTRDRDLDKISIVRERSSAFHFIRRRSQSGPNLPGGWDLIRVIFCRHAVAVFILGGVFFLFA